jgi:hypothetical protein
MRVLLLLSVVFLSSCAGGPPPPDWQLNSYAALNSYQAHYLKGDTRAAESEFARLKNEISATGRPGLIARVELHRCALRTASLEIDDCAAFRRADAGPEELAYYEYLSGKATRPATEDPLSRLVFLGVQFRTGKATPDSINSAVEIASEQGWRRPLLAWLGVQEKRAEAAGDAEALARIRRRIALASGKS